MNRYDSITSLIWFLAGLVIVIWSTLTLPIGTLTQPGPCFLPLLCGILICGLASMVFFQAKRKTEETAGESFYARGSLINIFSTIGILIVYALILERAGFIITTFVVMFFIFKKLAGASWLIGIVESLVVTGACYLLFGYFLKLVLPRGFLGI
jgi:putative tricarboxylic transport membrane protein